MSNTFQECFLAFIDVLGIKNLLRNFDENLDLVKNLIDILKINRKFETGTKLTSRGKIEIRSWYFSDSFVFMMKKEENEENLPQLLFIIRFLQDMFWKNGFLLRGSIILDEMYFPKENENVLLGKGIINAYELESKIAIYPRIILDDNLYKFIEEKDLQAYPFGKKGVKLKELIKEDKDSIKFLDLLNPNILRAKNEKIRTQNKSFSIFGNYNDENNFEMIKETVNKMIKNVLDDCQSDTKIRQKYKWLKSYLEEVEKESG